ncbi:MAG: nucleotide exchange factor GrpE [Turicibacter sp.]|nr:nucleotide exchange factor GrpE [Turicibacter sp.]
MVNFKEELETLVMRSGSSSVTEPQSEIAIACETFNATIQKFLKRQGSFNFQLEEMIALLEEMQAQGNSNQDGAQKMVAALVASADLIENLYLFYEENSQYESLFPQVRLMWKNIQKQLDVVGLTRIGDEQTPVQAEFNTVAGIESNPDFPHGYILKVLKSGYVYNGRIYRKSSVIANKLEVMLNE